MKKTIVNQTNGIVISINEDAKEMCLSHIRKGVAFTVALPMDEKSQIERWLCVHMAENDPQGYTQVVSEVNNTLQLNIPLEERRWAKTYKKHYGVNGELVHTVEYGAVHYDSTSIGERLASGEIKSITISDDEYHVVINSDLNMEIYEMSTGYKVFSIPLDTTNRDELAVLNLFKKEECLKYLRKYKALHLERISDPAKRALILDSAKYNFTKETLKSLVDTCAKYDDLGMMTTEYNNHPIGLVASVLWVYCGNRWITIWAYDEYGTEIEHLSFTQG